MHIFFSETERGRLRPSVDTPNFGPMTSVGRRYRQVARAVEGPNLGPTAEFSVAKQSLERFAGFEMERTRRAMGSGSGRMVRAASGIPVWRPGPEFGGCGFAVCRHPPSVISRGNLVECHQFPSLVSLRTENPQLEQRRIAESCYSKRKACLAIYGGLRGQRGGGVACGLCLFSSFYAGSLQSPRA